MFHKISSRLDSFIRSGLMTVFFLGFSSGFPCALIASVLLLRLAEAGIDIKSVGLFALISSAYTFKTIWAPLLDTLKPPLFQKLLGRRRGWICFIQILLIAFILLFGAANPVENIILFAALALCIAFLSATQDIVIDAYRIERIPTDLQPVGASTAGYGWHAGAFLAGVLTLVVAEKFSWSMAYYSAALCMIVGILTVLLSQEPTIEKKLHDAYKKGFEQFLIKTFVLPLKDLLVIDGIFYILAFIILFKLGDAMAGVMTLQFLKAKGFTKIEMALVVKTYGVIATIVGVTIGGFLAYRLPLRYSLLIAGILQMISNLLFVYQDHMGHNTTALMLTITGENLSSGIGSPILITYLSSLCNVRFAATHYALLASLASLARNILSSMSGFIVAPWGWSVFFLISTIAALPALLLLPKLTFIKGRRTSKPAS